MTKEEKILVKDFTMERLGFVRDMLDVKVLILFVAARVQRPVTVQNIYELSYQDERLSYFDVCEAVPQLVETGHLLQLEGELYEITDSGREVCAIMEETVAFPVAQRAKAAVEKFNQDVRRSGLMQTSVTEQPSGEAVVDLRLNDEHGHLMTLKLLAPSLRQGRRMEKTFRARAEKIYQTVMDQFLESTGKE